MHSQSSQALETRQCTRLRAIEAALKDDPSSFGHAKTPTDKILDAAEVAANLLEAAEMVPMYVPPTARIRFRREQPPEKRDRDAIRTFAYDLGLTLKKHCLLYKYCLLY